MSQQYRTPPNARDERGGIDLIAYIAEELKKLGGTKVPGGREITIKIFDDGNTFNQVNIDVLKKNRGTFVV